MSKDKHDKIPQRTRKENEKDFLARISAENPSPVIRVTKNGWIVYSNNACMKTKDMSVCESGQRLRADLLKGVKSAFRENRIKDVEINGNKRTFLFSIVPFKKDGYANLYGIDISGRREDKKKLEKLNKELEKEVARKTREMIRSREKLIETEKLSTLGKLAGMVGHEIKTPLAILVTSLHMLEKQLGDLSDNREVRKYLDMCKKQVSHSNAIINNVLTLVRIRSPRLSKTDSRGIITEVLNTVDIPGNIKVKNKTGKNMPDIIAENTQITLVFINIIKNALRAMNPDGGTLTIESGEKGNYLEIKFIDNGYGIRKKNLKKIFDMFFTTKAKGTGLGLSLCKSIIDAHKGELKVNSKVGQGTEFTVRLPKYKENVLK
jgi:signal transduction histidine kinase